MKKSDHILPASLAFRNAHAQTLIPLHNTLSDNSIHFYFDDSTKQFFIGDSAITIGFNGSNV